eukprot:2516938-Ditylum_brightwellii.AAC.1
MAAHIVHPLKTKGIWNFADVLTQPRTWKIFALLVLGMIYPSVGFESKGMINSHHGTMSQTNRDPSGLSIFVIQYSLQARDTHINDAYQH